MAQETRRYDRLAEQYSQYRLRYPGRLISHLAAIIVEAPASDLVVDVGAGTGFLPVSSGRCPMKSGSSASSPAPRSRTKEPRIPAAVLVRNAAALGVRLAARHGDRGRVRRRPCTAEQVVAGRHPKPFADPADRLAVGIALLRADPATRRREDVEVQSAKLAAECKKSVPNRAKQQEFQCSIASSSGEWRHQLPRIRERFQSPDCRQ